MSRLKNKRKTRGNNKMRFLRSVNFAVLNMVLFKETSLTLDMYNDGLAAQYAVM